jgi:phage terminase large subunit-like protein
MKINKKFLPLWMSKDIMGDQISEKMAAKYEGVDYFLLNSGRGPGKSFVLAQWALDAARRCEYQKIAYTRMTMASTDDSIIAEFKEKVEINRCEDEWDIQTDSATHEDGNFIKFMGLLTSSKKQSAKQKSLKDFNTWILEEGEECDDEDLFDKIDNSIRVAAHRCRVIIGYNAQHVSHMLFKRFYEGKMPDGSDVPYDYNGVIGNVCYIWSHWRENKKNLNRKFIAKAEAVKRTNPMRYNWIYRGMWQRDLEGALWNWGMIESAKALDVPNAKLTKICVSLDPTVAEDGEQDDCGIVVAGKSSDGFQKTLADHTGVLTVGQWANRVISLYYQWDANAIVYEKNQGGVLIEKAIRNAARALQKTDPNIRPEMIKIVPVHASKGKMTRAEPIATLYEFGKVAHSTGLGKLETEMCTYTGKDGEPSPGRFDANVWAHTWLSGAVHTVPKARSL